LEAAEANTFIYITILPVFSLPSNLSRFLGFSGSSSLPSKTKRKSQREWLDGLGGIKG
jgi:hypothetical protein